MYKSQNGGRVFSWQPGTVLMTVGMPLLQKKVPFFSEQRKRIIPNFYFYFLVAVLHGSSSLFLSDARGFISKFFSLLFCRFPLLLGFIPWSSTFKLWLLGQKWKAMMENFMWSKARRFRLHAVCKAHPRHLSKPFIIRYVIIFSEIIFNLSRVCVWPSKLAFQTLNCVYRSH